MAKKNVIKVEFDAPIYVLGIASNEKIWKVVWGINQELGLELASGQREDLASVELGEIYTDSDTHADFDYVFFENTRTSRKIPKLARNFRFWLVVRANREELPNISLLLQKLNQVDAVILAHDLSKEKDIKKLLP